MGMTCKLSPSILAADIARLGEEVRSIGEAGAEYVHVDIMDGMFVPNLSFGLNTVKGLRSYTDLFMDVHLMIAEPARYLARFAEAGADGITVHAEACSDLPGDVDLIRSLGKMPGVAIRPDTEIDAVLPVLDKVSMVLVMTVHPGYGGQKIITETFDKVRQLRQIVTERGIDVDIEVDGGVNMENIGVIREAGANVFVVGTKVFRGDIAENVGKLKEIIG